MMSITIPSYSSTFFFEVGSQHQNKNLLIWVVLLASLSGDALCFLRLQLHGCGRCKLQSLHTHKQAL